ncbi:MAG: Trm112 family protein [Syntrophales bacterium]
MKELLLEMLVCPVCLPDEIELAADIIEQEREEISEGVLTCPRCGGVYPIREGIAFLAPPAPAEATAASKYESAPVASSYLWSHYGDILGDPEASSAYREWAGLLSGGSGVALDIGSAVGRFSFEMSCTHDFTVGVDSSVPFIRIARELMIRGRKPVALGQEGLLTREEMVVLPATWQAGRVEFIVADALALPFRSGRFSTVAALNVVDKVRLPLKLLQEANRVAREHEARFVFSDPFSWSAEIAREEDWLGGKDHGPYTGRGIDNVIALLEGKDRLLRPAWHTARQGDVWWKIRNHANHFELIRSLFVTAKR